MRLSFNSIRGILQIWIKVHETQIDHR
jgi:hypothetical protein